MRKSFFAGLMLAVGAGSLPIGAVDTPDVLKGKYFSVFPAKYSADGKAFPFTYSREYGRGIELFHVYDEDMRLIKEIGPIDPLVYESKRYSQSRTNAYEYVEAVGEDVWDYILEINGVTTGLSIERVQNYLFAINGYGEIATLSDGTQVVALSFYDENAYGNKYPYTYYREINGEWHECRQYYEGKNWGPFGEWGEVEEYVDTETADPESIHLYPESGGECGYYRLTSGIFGDDYHYIIPLYESRSFENNREYPEKPGWIYEKSWGIRYEQTGVVVYDSTGKEVMTLKYPAGYSQGGYINFFQVGDKRYIAIDEVEDSEGIDYLLVYRLGEGNSVSFVTAAPSSKVSPRNPKRGENVSVTLDSPVVKDGAMVQVVSASGQTMLNTKIPAGQTHLDINTSAFPQGMYVVTVSGNGTTKEAAKIIVR